MISQRRIRIAALLVMAGAAAALQFSPSAQACLECGSIRYSCMPLNTCLQMSQFQKQYDCDNNVTHEQVCYAKCNDPCVATTPGVKCAGGPAIECHYNTLPPVSSCSTVQPCGSSLTLVSLTTATLPSNRARTKLGVGETTTLTLVPAPACAVTWSLAGNGTLSALSGTSTAFTAHDRASIPTVTATVNSIQYSITYNVVEPSGIAMQQNVAYGIWHRQGFASVGFKGAAYVTPEDVSFDRIEVREGFALGVGTQYLSFKTGEAHPNGPWIAIDPGTTLHPNNWNGIDTIQTGQYPPPFNSGGTFTWPIPWIFRVPIVTGIEKQFTTVTHFEQVDQFGTASISKGGTTRSRLVNDPDSNY